MPPLCAQGLKLAPPALARFARPLANRRFRWLLIAVALPLPLLQYLVVTAQLSADLIEKLRDLVGPLPENVEDV